MRFFRKRKKRTGPPFGFRWQAVRRNRIEQEYLSPTVAAARWLDAVAALVFTAQGRILLIAFLPIAFFALLLTRSPAFLLFLLVLHSEVLPYHGFHFLFNLINIGICSSKQFHI